MDARKIFEFISKQKTAFIASVDEQGFPVIRAMLAPRKIDGNTLYFTTNTSSKKIKHFTENKNSCVYFYKRGKIRYQGATLTGTMEICTDQPTKDMIWRKGDGFIYKKGVTDPDYCVLKFTAETCEYYCDLKTYSIEFN